VSSEDPNEKVLRPLFGARRDSSQGTEDPKQESQRDDDASADADAISKGLDALLRDALPEAASEPPAPRAESPPEGHRNARMCPQCDQRTWLYTRECVHCKFDIWEYEADLERMKRQAILENERKFFQHIALSCVAVFMGCILLGKVAPDWLIGPLLLVGAASFILAALFFNLS